MVLPEHTFNMTFIQDKDLNQQDQMKSSLKSHSVCTKFYKLWDNCEDKFNSSNWLHHLKLAAWGSTGVGFSEERITHSFNNVQSKRRKNVRKKNWTCKIKKKEIYYLVGICTSEGAILDNTHYK